MNIIMKKKPIKIFDYVYVQNGKYKGFFGKIILIKKKNCLIFCILNNYIQNINTKITNLCLI